MSGSYADESSYVDLSLEELITLEVTSVAKKPQKPEEAAAALTVITAEDLRRAGVSTLPEALRLAPGVEVAEIDGNITAVTVRGFNWRFASKLLVLVDGRSIYNPSLTGLFWDQQLVPIEDIQRIELVRGPGATMWGANAVNGVINIVTKHAADTLGGAASAEVSSEDAHRIFGRYGTRLGEEGAVRVYGVQRRVASLTDADGEEWNAGTDAWQAGFRMDIEPGPHDSITLQGDVQQVDFESTVLSDLSGGLLTSGNAANSADGYNLLGRWVHDFSDTNALTVQAYVDHVTRNEFSSSFEVTAYDLDISHRSQPLDSFSLVWGLNSRSLQDSVSGGFGFEPPKYSYNWLSGFAQGEWEALPERLRLTFGVKLEDNSFTGFENQPSLRAIWLGENNWSVWGATSRAVRTPSRFERDIQALITTLEPNSALNDQPIPINLYLRGSKDFEVEEMVAVELGFRKAFDNGAELDIALYQHEYEQLLTTINGAPDIIMGMPFGPEGPTLPVAIEQSIYAANGGDGMINGVEASLKLQPTPRWSLSAIADIRDPDLPETTLAGDNSDAIVEFAGASPAWQAQLRSHHELRDNLDLSWTVRHVDALEATTVDAYTDIDIHATWRVNDRLELTLLGENLAEPRRAESEQGVYPAPTGYIERRVTLRAGLRF